MKDEDDWYGDKKGEKPMWKDMRNATDFVSSSMPSFFQWSSRICHIKYLEKDDVGELLGELLVVGGNDLARPAPGGIEVHHYGLAPRASQNLVELLLGGDHLDHG